MSPRGTTPTRFGRTRIGRTGCRPVRRSRRISSRWPRNAASVRTSGSAPTSPRPEYDDGKWRLTTADGEETFDVLVTATGVLRVPRYPDIAGRDTFAGPAFHSSRWDHSVSLPDKRIGLIGTGSTGVQITAELGGKVRALKVFQRTAQWIYPLPNPRYSTLTQAALARWPRLNGLPYRFWGLFFRTHVRARAHPPGMAAHVWSRPNAGGTCGSRCATRSCGPSSPRTYQPMCKRQIIAGPLLPFRPAARRRGDHRARSTTSSPAAS